jgi:hypothetical protein
MKTLSDEEVRDFIEEWTWGTIILIFCTPIQAEVLIRAQSYLGSMVHGFGGNGGCIFNIHYSFVTHAPSIWWGKYSHDGRKINQITSQSEADMGAGSLFYDTRVWVETTGEKNN